ncbi:T9SS type A sorting domain-containing protein [Chryseobacterium fistulae]|uniref:Peptidase M12B domain-containing protein n=1 Tax=Chryseobacterium fistulae TaxID=2675058 RepID=A0A6N4XLY4_9FLAO|nr:T9SS type A sorting domain-containing protein [Chryseobacterium fistulae]CAA7386888.1 hypothetical protein CHRY9393_01189 [Chryseobacterium fistulae]
MVRKIIFFSMFLCLIQVFSQHLNPITKKISESHKAGASFRSYSLFESNPRSLQLPIYQKAATDISVMNIDYAVLQEILKDKPESLVISFPFNGNKNITIELLKNNIFTDHFRVQTNEGKIISYNPGVYYQGIVKGDFNSIVAFSFFENDVVGIASTPELGNIVVGKVKNSDDFVSYSESKLTGKNPFICGVDEFKTQDKLNGSPDLKSVNKNVAMSQNCVRVYYEICFAAYQNNNSDITTVTNWLTAIHNNIATLYYNDDIKTALSEIFVWVTQDPYTGTPNDNLNNFRNTRLTFNGDLAHLINSPSTTSVAYLNSLCTEYRYAYSGVSQTYSNVPVYSWTVGAMAHEMGHGLGSPHTHACAWNGNNTAIDGCGAQAGYNEGCSGVIPSSGTIMSYCHLIQGVGINFSYGFGPQPAQLIRNTIDTKACLGTDCTTSCGMPITDISFVNITQNSAGVVINDIISSSWKYKLTTIDGTLVSVGNTNSPNFNMTNLQPGTYYRLYLGTSCSLADAYLMSRIFLTDADWCNSAPLKDSGGDFGNYGNNEILIKTFYPTSGSSLTLMFTDFALEKDYDYMYIYNGPSTSSPLFSNGNEVTGNAIPGPYTSTHSTGAITIKFVSDTDVTDAGWKANFSCSFLAIEEGDVKDRKVNIYPNPAKNTITVSSVESVKSYTIYDESGRLIKDNVPPHKGNKFDVDISSFPAGNYIMTVRMKNQTINKKLIIQ